MSGVIVSCAIGGVIVSCAIGGVIVSCAIGRVIAFCAINVLVGIRVLAMRNASRVTRRHPRRTIEAGRSYALHT
jgi:hypothetical protein